MTEAKIQKKILDLLEKQGYWATKIIKANKNGTPDIIACEPGTALFVAFECKKPGEEPTPLQKYQIRKIHKTGGRAYVVESVEEVKLILGLTSSGESVG